MTDGRRDSTSNENLSILLLEDDDGDAYLTRRALQAIPAVGEVVRARNGQEALDLLRSGKYAPDIAFVDLQMPTMDGFDFLGAAGEQGLPTIPMVVLTSSSATKDALRSRVRGALQVITKPEGSAELRQALEDAIHALTGPARPLYPGYEPPLSTAPRSPPPRPATPAAAPASPAPTFGRRVSR